MTKPARLITLIGMLALCLCGSARPKVGVVLSGGGAKGVAHIGALRVIEEAGIPIDIIVGTSMGSIIGGLYAIGYTTEQLDSIVMAQDWNNMLSDKSPRKLLDLQTRESNSRYVLSVPFFDKPQDLISGGVIKGRNIGQMLWQLTEGYHDSIDFRKMPIPFACVAQDLVTGEEVVFHSGVLPIAIRSSMSIPGVFAPISTNGMVLIDGGLVNNYPVDIAREMGADIIIGVDVRDPLKNGQELQGSIVAQLSQLIDLQGKERWHRNISDTDVYIKVNVKGYSSASFSTTAIDSLINRGEQAARIQTDSLLAIGRKFPDKTAFGKRPTPPYYYTHHSDNIETHHTPALKTLIGDNPTNSINLGLRFDNEELAALLFNGRLKMGRKRNHHIELTLKLGRQMFGDAHYRLHMGKDWNLATGYRYTYNEFNIYEKGHRNVEISFHQHSADIGFTKSWKVFHLRFGGRYQLYNYSSFLYRLGDSGQAKIDKESYLKFGMEYILNTTDDNYFPTRGNDLRMEYHYNIPLNGNSSFHTAGVHWTAAFSPNRRTVFMPCIEARYLTTENTMAEVNTLGGQESGKYFSQQIPFYGINHFETSRNTLVIAGIGVRQRLYSRHYISAIFNMALTSDDWKHFFSHSFDHNDDSGYHIFGGAVKYDLRTFLGPIGLTLQYSNRAKLSGYFRAGFTF